MPTNRISPARLRNLKPGRYCDGAGLWLFIKPNHEAYWSLRYRFQGRNREMGLGPLHTVNAEKAREQAKRFRNMVRDGLDPLHERAKSLSKPVISFKEAAEKMLEAKRPEWKNAKHAQQWENTLKTYAYPVIGDLAVSAIDTVHIRRILEPEWATKTETMTRVRQRIEAVLDWATACGYREGVNPARWKGHLNKIMSKPSKVKKVHHHAALPYQEIPSFWPKLKQQPGTAALALQFTILSAARTGEIIGARKSEISEGVWTIPGERMKAGKVHRVPLSRQALAITEALPESDSPFLFPGARHNQPLSNMSLAAVIKRMERDDLTVHGFRSSFRDWCAEVSTFPREVAESALAHSLKDKTEAAYQRGDLLQKRSLLMQAWADFVCTPRAKGDVVPIRKAAAK